MGDLISVKTYIVNLAVYYVPVPLELKRKRLEAQGRASLFGGNRCAYHGFVPESYKNLVDENSHRRSCPGNKNGTHLLVLPTHPSVEPKPSLQLFHFIEALGGPTK
jgi:hypothetical protein